MSAPFDVIVCSSLHLDVMVYGSESGKGASKPFNKLTPSGRRRIRRLLERSGVPAPSEIFDSRRNGFALSETLGCCTLAA
jgi:hypothetical protein